MVWSAEVRATILGKQSMIIEPLNLMIFWGCYAPPTNRHCWGISKNNFPDSWRELDPWPNRKRSVVMFVGWKRESEWRLSRGNRAHWRMLRIIPFFFKTVTRFGASFRPVALRGTSFKQAKGLPPSAQIIPNHIKDKRTMWRGWRCNNCKTGRTKGCAQMWWEVLPRS